MAAVLKLRIEPPVTFPSPEEAWVWCCTAVVARARGEEIPNGFPYDPDLITEAAEAAAWDKFEWQVMIDAGIEGECPLNPFRAALYYAALRRLNAVMVNRGLI